MGNRNGHRPRKRDPLHFRGYRPKRCGHDNRRRPRRNGRDPCRYSQCGRHDAGGRGSGHPQCRLGCRRNNPILQPKHSGRPGHHTKSGPGPSRTRGHRGQYHGQSWSGTRVCSQCGRHDGVRRTLGAHRGGSGRRLGDAAVQQHGGGGFCHQPGACRQPAGALRQRCRACRVLRILHGDRAQCGGHDAGRGGRRACLQPVWRLAR